MFRNKVSPFRTFSKKYHDLDNPLRLWKTYPNQIQINFRNMASLLRTFDKEMPLLQILTWTILQDFRKPLPI